MVGGRAGTGDAGATGPGSVDGAGAAPWVTGGGVRGPNQPVWLIATISPVRAVRVAVTAVMIPGSVCHQLVAFPASVMGFSMVASALRT